MFKKLAVNRHFAVDKHYSLLMIIFSIIYIFIKCISIPGSHILIIFFTIHFPERSTLVSSAGSMELTNNNYFCTMVDQNLILEEIKNTVKAIDPSATLILYGSRARGNYREDSDIDLIILVDKEDLTNDDEIKITYPIYDIEYRTTTLISPMVYTKKAWANHKITPFFENVLADGKVL